MLLEIVELFVSTNFMDFSTPGYCTWKSMASRLCSKHQIISSQSWTCLESL